MSKIKQSISFVLICMCFFQLFTLSIFAQSESDGFVVQKNELEIIQELEKEGRASIDLKENLREAVYSLQNMEIQDLEKMGYTNRQIEAIKNFDGSDEMLMRASAKLTFSMQIEKYTYSNSDDLATAKVKVSYEWSGTPAMKMDDVLAFLWDENFDIDLDSSYLTVRYSNDYYGTSYSKTYDFVERGLNMAECVFPLHDSKWYGSELIGHTGLKGNGYLYFTKQEYIKVFKLYGDYGHTGVHVGSPGISVGNSSVGAGINFTVGTDSMGGKSASKVVSVV